MSESGSEKAVESSLTDHPEQSLETLSGGGFALVQAGRSGVRATADGDGWNIAAPGLLNGSRLTRLGGPGAGFLLLRDDASTEEGRTTPITRDCGVANLPYVLLGDGRLFRIQPGPPRQGGFQLLGWETPGAYMIARPEPVGWTLVPTPACGGIHELEAISILFAAEILDAEGTLVGF